MPPGIPGTDVLSLTVGEELLSALETDEWGKPLALKTVIVGQQTKFWFFFRHGNDPVGLNFYLALGRSSFAAVVGIGA